MTVILDRYAPSWGKQLSKRTKQTLYGSTPATLREMEPVTVHKGTGILSGSFPTSVLGIGTATVKALMKSSLNSVNGLVAGATTVEPNGSWAITGLNTDMFFDVVIDIPGYNGVILSNVKPV